MLAKLQNYKTTKSTTFSTGMNVTLLSSGVSQAISTATSSGTTATITTSAAHGYSTSNVVAISGISPVGFNGTFTITVTSTTTFTYTLAATLSGASGTTQQYYPFPEGEITISGMYITVGSVNFPLKIINSQYDWNQLNAIQVQASALPQFYFPRRDDFGIWPIPQAVYTGTIQYHYRDRNLSVADYSTGTVSVTANSYQVTGSGTTFTSAMVGRWFTVTDPTLSGQGYWYRVNAYTDATHIQLDNPYTGSTGTGVTYRIGESPELPEEGHQVLTDGVTAGYYANVRKDLTTAALFYNKFWTGDPNNNSRQEGNSKISAGLIGMMNRYANRDNTRIITRRPKLNPLNFKVWATSIS